MSTEFHESNAEVCRVSIGLSEFKITLPPIPPFGFQKLMASGS
jgi:hypothetical protein